MNQRPLIPRPNVPANSLLRGDNSDTPIAIPRNTETGGFLSVTLPLGGAGERVLDVPDFGVPDAPLVVTVGLDRRTPRGIGDYVTADVRASVFFGVGGSNMQVECDWAHGIQLTAPATTVRVSAIGFNPHADTEYVGQLFELRAVIAAASRGPCACPRYSIPFRLTAAPGPGAQATFRLPPFASRVAVLASQVTTGQNGYTGDLSLLLGAGGATDYSSPVLNGQPVPVPSASPGTATIVNASLATAYRGKLLFDLAF